MSKSFACIRRIIFALFVIFLAGCAAGKSNVSRVELHDGGAWEHITGAGLDFRAKRTDNLNIAIESSIPGAVLVDSSGIRLDTLMRVFKIRHNSINEMLSVLSREKGWKKDEECRFKKIQSGRKGVKRYVLVPAGSYADSIARMMKDSPVPSTCSGWGVGNSGMRYFEKFDSCPDKVLFVEIGQEQPLFDENSITLLP